MQEKRISQLALDPTSHVDSKNLKARSSPWCGESQSSFSLAVNTPKEIEPLSITTAKPASAEDCAESVEQLKLAEYPGADSSHDSIMSHCIVTSLKEHHGTCRFRPRSKVRLQWLTKTW